jgi:hypothetical protein
MARTYADQNTDYSRDLGAEDRLKFTLPGFPCQHDN